MGKILIALTVAAAIAFLARRGWFRQPKPLPSALLSSDELAPYFEGLKNSNDDYAFIIVTIEGTEDFLQFQDSGHGLFVDFPLATERQQSFEGAARTALAAEGFVVDESLSRINGSINARANRSPEEAAVAVGRLMQRIFGAASGAQLRVEWSGVEPAAA